MRQCIGEAIAEVERGAVPPLTEPPPSVHGSFGEIVVQRDRKDTGLTQRPLRYAHGSRPPGLQHNPEFDNGRRADKAIIRETQLLFEPIRPGLTRQDCDEGGGVNYEASHVGRPASS